MKETIQFGIIGAGQIGKRSAAEIGEHAHGRVLAAQDTNAERLQSLCTEHSIPRSYPTAKELFADKEIDAVYIAVPNKFHAPLAIEALEAGKHVILEKPFAMNAREAEAVIEAAKKAGKAFTVGMNMRFNEDSLKIASAVRNGILGQVYHAKAFWFRREGIPKLGTWFGKKELAGGGCLYDIGVHALDLCLFVLNRFDPVSVSGATYQKFGHRGLGEGSWGHSDREFDTFDVEDFSSSLIRFADGTTVSLDLAWACHMEEKNRNDVQLYGTDAGATCVPSRIIRKSPESGGYLTVEHIENSLSFTPNRFHNFINHIHDEEELCVKPAEALQVQRILDAIEESSEQRKEVIL